MDLQGGQDRRGRARALGRELHRSPLRRPAARSGGRSQATADLPRGRLRRKVRNALHRGRQLREALQRQKEGGGGPILVLQEGRLRRLETRLHPEGTGNVRPESRQATRQARLLRSTRVLSLGVKIVQTHVGGPGVDPACRVVWQYLTCQVRRLV